MVQNAIDQGELRRGYYALAAEIPRPFELSGITYHGGSGHREWVAFVYPRSNAGGAPGPRRDAA